MLHERLLDGGDALCPHGEADHAVGDARGEPLVAGIAACVIDAGCSRSRPPSRTGPSRSSPGSRSTSGRARLAETEADVRDERALAPQVLGVAERSGPSKGHI
jgi:hypothetical protein